MSGVDLKSVSQSRRIFFRSTGGTYSAMFMSDRGDLYQEYEEKSGGGYNFYPDFVANPVTLRLTVVSSKSAKAVAPVSVQYYVNNKALSFNTSGTCIKVGDSESSSLTSLFALSGSDLIIKGNIAGFAGFASFMISVEAFMSSTSGSESVTGHIQCTVAEYNPASPGTFSIQPGDNKNFTISEKGGNCVLKARHTLKGIDSYPTDVLWDQLIAGAWTQVAASGNTYNVQESQVETYSIFRATWGEFSDSQGVQDASDPYDVSVQIKVSTDGDTDAVSTSNEELTDEMPGKAYLQYIPTLVVRGSNKAYTGNVTWNQGELITATGLNLEHIPFDTATNSYKITVDNLKAAGGVGEYDFVYSGTIN